MTISLYMTVVLCISKHDFLFNHWSVFSNTIPGSTNEKNFLTHITYDFDTLYESNLEKRNEFGKPLKNLLVPSKQTYIFPWVPRVQSLGWLKSFRERKQLYNMIGRLVD